MQLPPIETGDLLAYLDGVAQPHVEHALQESAHLRQELAALRQMDHTLRKLLGNLPIPEPQDLVDVATGQATAEQQLRVAAYLQANPVGQHDMSALVQGHTKPRRLTLPRFVALPQTVAMGTRSLTQATPEQSFYASELDVQVIVRVSPPAADRWQLMGYVTRNDQPVPQVRVTLRATHARPRPRYTDDDGFFTFKKLSIGVYRLQVQFNEGVIIIPAINLDYI